MAATQKSAQKLVVRKSAQKALDPKAASPTSAFPFGDQRRFLQERRVRAHTPSELELLCRQPWPATMGGEASRETLIAS